MENKTKIIFVIIIIVLLLVGIIIIKEREGKKEPIKENLLKINYDIDGNESTLNYETENPVVALYVKNYGSIVMELYPEYAENTVNNFISLVKSGFYDNNSFHRLVPGFVLQGGDPDGQGTGGPGYSIKGEFSNNGYEQNTLSHEKGIVSMARSQDNDSAGSQFFICIDDAKDSLDNQYAAFGKVIDGWDNIDNIVENEQIADEASGKLQNNLVIKKAIVDTKGKEYPEPEKIEE